MGVALLAIGMAVVGFVALLVLVYYLGVAVTHFLGEDQRNYELVLVNGLLAVCALIVIGLMAIMFASVISPLA